MSIDIARVWGRVFFKAMVLAGMSTASFSASAQVDGDSDGIPDITENQCTPNLALMSEAVADGVLTAGFDFPDGTTGSFTSTEPTDGAFNADRPAYNSDEEYALVLRGGGFGAVTTLTFDQPLGNESVFLLADVNKLENQQITAYAEGVAHYPVAIELGDGAQLTGENSNILIDADGDDSYVDQAYLRFRFAVGIDSLVVSSVGTSDDISISIPLGCTENTDQDGDTVFNRNDPDSDGDNVADLIEAYDVDHDGVADTAPDPENLNPPLPDTDGDELPDFLDSDDDGDGLLTGDADGIDTDLDADGTPDYLDTTDDRTDTDEDGRVDDLDSDDDADGVTDAAEGDGVTDTDGDDVPDSLDDDSDGDQIPDLIEAHDADEDGFPDVTPSSEDEDEDGLDNAFDPDFDGGVEAPLPNTDQQGGPNFQDNDDDGDGIPTVEEISDVDNNNVPDYLQALDSDGDQVADHIDLDDDNDGILDSDEGEGDTDGDQIADQFDLDSDDDGVFDLTEAGHDAADVDSDHRVDSEVGDNGYADELEEPAGVVNYTLLNTDGDDKSNFQDRDDDGDTVYTQFEGAPEQDTDGDQLADYLDPDDDGDSLLTINETPDPNGDGNPDDALNSDGEGLPDYLQVADDIADLALTKTGFPNTQLVGESVFFNVKIANHGPENATGIVVQDLIPDGYTLDFQSVGDDYDENTGTWLVGDLSSGSDTSILFRAVVNEQGERTNTATVVASDFADSNSENNTASFTVIVTTDPVDTNTDNDEVSDVDDLDDDNDGILDALEQATATNGGDTDGDNTPDELDLDSDGDLVPDVLEAGHNEPDSNDDFMIDSPVGENGFADVLESAPGVPNYALRDTDLDGTKDYQDTDDDDDGVDSFYEGGQDGGVLNTDGTGLPDYLDDDDDDDGFATNLENADPNDDGNPDDAVDSDGDNIPDYLDAFGVDSDGDEVPDEVDIDDDNDGILDILENATALNGGDTDQDGTDDWLDLDSDDDGLSDAFEAAHGAASVDGQVTGEVGANGYLDSLEQGEETGTPNYFLPDLDNDHVTDYQDEDDDGDSVFTQYEGATDQDTDGDELPDYQDTDDDDDATLTIDENPDPDNNGDPADAVDTDGDNTPDYLDDLGFDLDGDQVQDSDDLDDDNDGIPDTLEEATALNGGDTDDDDTPDAHDSDSDGDQVADYIEAGHENINVDGAGYLLGDVGSNGLLDSLETSADSGEINYTLLDTDSAGLPNFQTLDEDGDGLLNEYEGIPNQNSDSDTIPDFLDADDDGDAIPTADENADINGDHNPDDALDSDGDQIPDYLDHAGEDHDEDGVVDTEDLDSDNDGILDSLEQETALNGGDTDQDNIPDIYDLDSDGDEVPDYVEAGHGATDDNGDHRVDGVVGDNGYLDSLETAPDSDNPNYFVRHSDDDVLPDFQDTDDDNDGLDTEFEDAPDQDSDDDNLADYRDADDDNDGLPTAEENADPDEDGNPADALDSDLDGTPDYLDTLNDTDGDQVADGDDLDDDNDGLLDAIENDTALHDGDTDEDGVPDSQDLDSDGDQLADYLEADHGAAADANDRVVGDVGENGLLDSLETVADSGTPGYFPLNSDDDALPDFQDKDDDNDGLFTQFEIPFSLNTDGDSLPNCRDADDDGDNLLTANENADPDGNGDPADAIDGDDNDVPDYLDPADVVVNADIQVTLTASATELNEGDEIFLNINVTNRGDDDATGVQMELNLPASLSYLWDTAGDSYDEALGVWTIDGLTSGSNQTMLVRVEAVAGGEFNVVATVSADQFDPDNANNSAIEMFTIVGADDSDGDLIPDEDDIDDDNDGWPDEYEQGTALNGGDTDGDQIPDSRDLDSDGDGEWDYIELGHGQADTDDDHRVDGPVGDNGLLDALETGDDNGLPNYIPIDTDSDNIFNFQDADEALDTDGDSVIDDIDIDDDNDGLLDDLESGLAQNGGDTDGDNIADEFDLDADGDQVADWQEAGHGLADVTGDRLNGSVGSNGYLDSLETDDDGVPNFAPFDHDQDAILDFLDKDDDGDLVWTEYEGAPNQNTDGDSLADYLDDDDDNDNVLTRDESPDQNGDGNPDDALDSGGSDLPDYLDPDTGLDSDGDQLSDAFDADDDNDGIPDAVETAFATNAGDSDGDNTPDELDLDSDGDQLPDVDEAGHGVAGNQDDRLEGEFGSNGFLDAVEFFVGAAETGALNYTLADSNNDGLPDYLDASNSGLDSDGDQVLDTIDLDDDNDGILDSIERSMAQSGGYNDDDGIPAELDLDSDGDNVPDWQEAGHGETDVSNDRLNGSFGENGYLDSLENNEGGEANFTYLDSDLDSSFDFQDRDDDGDSIYTRFEGPISLNTDGDGLPNYLDSDDDGDEILTIDESPDQNGDGNPDDALDSGGTALPDYLEPEVDEGVDTDGDQVVDEFDLDDDNDGIPDAIEIQTAINGGDTDGDSTPDELDADSDWDFLSDAFESGHGQVDSHTTATVSGEVGDNGLLDVLEDGPESGVVSYLLKDTDADGLPDFQELDDDNDLLHTRYEGAPVEDLDGDETPDYLDADDDDDGIPTRDENPDPNGNGQPDDAEDANGNGTPDYMEDTSSSGGVRLGIKVFLQGAMEADAFTGEQTAGLMWDKLREKGLLPESEPYSDLAGFTPVGSGGQEVAADGVFDVTGENAIVDWVFVELRTDTELAEVVATQSALLQRDGDVVDVDGVSAVLFEDVQEGTYKVAIRHRNHLGAMKSDGVELSSTPTVIDFTEMDEADLFHRTASQPAQIQLGEYHSGMLAEGYGVGSLGKMALWAGNSQLSGDTIEFVSQQGGSNDRDRIYADVLGAAANTTRAVNFIFKAYSNSDINMDGEVRAQGVGGLDPQIGFVNLLRHPNNPSNSFNFLATEQLP